MLPWFGKVFVNHPYGRELPLWIAKAHQELACGRAEVVVVLMPARTDTAYWHTHVARASSIFFLRSRLQFDEQGQAAPFPSALVAWGATQELLTRA
jgi:DNA N-6-adenine-methyltransferase (Dam)